MQSVIRPHLPEYHDFRGFAGRIAGGVFKPGDEVLALPSGFTSRIKTIHTLDGDVEEAFAPMSVAITLEDEIDISRGDMIAKPNNLPESSQDLEVMLCWFSEQKLRPNGRYVLRHTTREAKCLVKAVRYKVDINTLHKIEDEVDDRHERHRPGQIRATLPIFHDTYRRNRNTGSLILVDEFTNNTVAAGMIL